MLEYPLVDMVQWSTHSRDSPLPPITKAFLLDSHPRMPPQTLTMANMAGNRADSAHPMTHGLVLFKASQWILARTCWSSRPWTSIISLDWPSEDDIGSKHIFIFYFSSRLNSPNPRLQKSRIAMATSTLAPRNEPKPTSTILHCILDFNWLGIVSWWTSLILFVCIFRVVLCIRSIGENWFHYEFHDMHMGRENASIDRFAQIPKVSMGDFKTDFGLGNQMG